MAMSAPRIDGPRLGQIVAPLLTAAVVTAALYFFGVELAFAVAWGTLISVIIIARQAAPALEEPGWPPSHRPFTTVRGSDVSRLAWSFVARTGAAGPTIVRHVRNLVRRRLTHRGIDIDDAAMHARADELLGEGVRAGLFQNHVNRTDIEHALDAVERLPLTAESAGSYMPQHPEPDNPLSDHAAKEDR